jgi:hypothetical protein
VKNTPLQKAKEGKLQGAAKRFDAKGLLNAVRKHAGEGGPTDLSVKQKM